MAETAAHRRVAVVLGGASGIGAATAAALAAGGDLVVVGDIAASGSGTAESQGPTAELPCDVTDEESVIDFFDAVVTRFGVPDVAVNCAGVSGTFGPVGDLGLESWRRTLDVNLTGMFLCLREEVRAMTAGAIVNVSSGAGLRGFAQLPDYVASKHGVIGLTRSVALEVARRGLRVNAVCPGTVRTPMLEGFTGGDEQSLAAMGRMSPVGRLGAPEEIAAAIVWLCSAEASFMTGAVVSADGGVSAA